MKKLLICVMILSVCAISVGVSAQGPGMMWGGQQGWNYCPYCGQDLGQGGYGMGPGMMGPGYYGKNEECQEFFDQNAGLRKELNSKRFDYFEAARNPKTTRESLAKLENEIRDLQEKIYAKAPQACWGR